MNEIQHGGASTAATPAGAPPPIASLRGYWIIVLPLIALAAQFVIGLVIGYIAEVIGHPRSQLLFIFTVAGLSALSYGVILQILLSVRGWRWRDLGLRKCAALPIVVAGGGGLVTALVASLFEHWARPAHTSMFRGLSGLEFAAAGLVVGILVPIAEEAIFRGVVYPLLRARMNHTLGAVIVSALIFGGFHLYPPQILIGFCLGLPLAYLRHWSNSLVAPIALHMAHNLGVVLLADLRIV